MPGSAALVVADRVTTATEKSGSRATNPIRLSLEGIAAIIMHRSRKCNANWWFGGARFEALCVLCVLCVSVVDDMVSKIHHKDTENTEVHKETA